MDLSIAILNYQRVIKGVEPRSRIITRCFFFLRREKTTKQVICETEFTGFALR